MDGSNLRPHHLANIAAEALAHTAAVPDAYAVGNALAQQGMTNLTMNQIQAAAEILQQREQVTAAASIEPFVAQSVSYRVLVARLDLLAMQYERRGAAGSEVHADVAATLRVLLTEAEQIATPVQ